MSTPAAIDPDLQKLLDKAARLKRRLNFRAEATKTLQKRYDALKDQIAARVPAECGKESGRDLGVATAGGGVSYNLSAAGGANIRVTQPAPKLIGKISGELVPKLRKLCGKVFDRLFVTHYTCQKNVRVLALQELSKENAKALIALVEEQSAATVTIS